MSNLDVAQTIRDQLGPVTLALLGARQLLGGSNFLQFSIQGCRKINKIRIELQPTDLYRVEFFHVARRTFGFKLVASHDDVHVESLKRLIEDETGLCTSF